MKLRDLLQEMPRLSRNEMDDGQLQVEVFFLTDANIKNLGYTSVGKRADVEVMLKKDLTTAIVGTRQKRHDGVDGILVYGQIIFKEDLVLSNKTLQKFAKPHNILQIELVEIARENKFAGLASFMYSSIVQAGYTVISDTLQFKGGAELWKKIARSHLPNEAVWLIDHGDVTLDADGKPVEYDGKNMPDSEIWSLDDDSKKYLLFVYSRRN